MSSYACLVLWDCFPGHKVFVGKVSKARGKGVAGMAKGGGMGQRGWGKGGAHREREGSRMRKRACPRLPAEDRGEGRRGGWGGGGG